MTMHLNGDAGKRVLFAAPTAKDASITAAILDGARIRAVSCRNLHELSSEIDSGVGAILLTGEALSAAGIDELVGALKRQPSWSEPPVVVLMSGAAHSPVAAPVLAGLGNVTLLERPAPIRSMLSAVQAGLRGRDRQYQIRDQIDAVRQAEMCATELRQQLELAINASELGIFHWEMPEDRMIWNDRCKAHFWLEPETEIDVSLFYSMLHPDDRERTRRAVEACLYGGQCYDTEFRTVSAKGDIRWIRATGRAYHDAGGEPLRFDGTTQDITARKRTEEALREADRRKDEFLAMLAHELRNPLAPIRNAVQSMHLRNPDDPDIRKTGDMIARQVRHLARLVDDLLDVSRVTQGKVALRKERVEITQVVHSGIELALLFIDAKHHDLTLTLPPLGQLHIECDATRIAQVLGNLLDNAAKYTDEGGRIGITVMREGDSAAIRVRDNGIGIASDLLPRIFDLFSQAERSLDRAQGGLGIGLSLVRTMVELHGGTVEARSEGPGAGSEFTVRLPLVGAGARRVAAPDESAAPAAVPRRIMVVDDNIDSAESLRTLLEIGGHEVRCAYEGRGALDTAAVFRPEIALLDLGLPGMDGLELARRLRERPENRGTLLVALTGYGQLEDRRRTEAAGFDHHLVKPVDPVQLIAIIAGSSGPARRRP